MNIQEKILRTENEFPKTFTSWIEKDYGLLLYDINNIESHDSNHAVLYIDEISDMEYVLEDIKDFYISKGITPRIYQPFSTGYFTNHWEAFDNLGFNIEIYGNNHFMLLTQENTINIEKRLIIKRLLEWDDHIAEDIYIPNGEEYEIEVAKNSLKNKDNYMFVGYLKDTPVTIIYFHISEYGCTRFDYILTSKSHRKKGYGREILSYAVDYCNENSIPNCYQWPAHETSKKMCYEAGFRVVFEVEAGSAVYPGK